MPALLYPTHPTLCFAPLHTRVTLAHTGRVTGRVTSKVQGEHPELPLQSCGDEVGNQWSWGQQRLGKHEINGRHLPDGELAGRTET